MEMHNEIRDFLMSRRGRVTPQQAGLPFGGGDRRVAGLRREEVAMLAGVSVEYYTRLERGRLGGASESVLEAIALVLQLDDDERAHLYDLARSVTPGTRRRKPTARTTPVDASVRQVLESMSVPAIVQNARLDVLASNNPGRALYSVLFDGAAEAPNFARFAFLDSRAQNFYPDLDGAKDLVVSVLRATAGRDPLDRKTTELVGELSTRSADFAARWAKHDVMRHTRGRKLIHHPAVGPLDLEYNDFALPGDPEISITTYTATPGSPSADGLTLLATWIDTHEIQHSRSDVGVRTSPAPHRHSDRFN
jgi:transcriptional regulator with XRE-family HTH domain